MCVCVCVRVFNSFLISCLLRVCVCAGAKTIVIDDDLTTRQQRCVPSLLFFSCLVISSFLFSHVFSSLLFSFNFISLLPLSSILFSLLLFSSLLISFLTNLKISSFCLQSFNHSFLSSSPCYSSDLFFTMEMISLLLFYEKHQLFTTLLCSQI